MISTIFTILHIITGQLGPNYNPLFYDVMIYIFGIVIAVIVIIIAIIILKKRGKRSNQPGKTYHDF